MTTQPVEPGLDRRDFLKALALVAAAAAAGGSAAAVLKRPNETVITAIDPAPAFVPPATVANPTPAMLNSSNLTARLAASQAENMRLQADLAAAQRRLSGIESANGSASDELATLRAELAGANDRIGLLGGLVTLYEQLDDIDLDGLVHNGLSSVGEAFDDLVERVPTLETGLAMGAEALDNLENEIPLVQSGRDWAESRAQLLGDYFQDAENVLAAALDSAGDFLEMIGQWFANVLKWVPFGMGDKAAQVVASLTGLLQQTPDTVDGLNRYVAQPLDVWLAGDGEELALRRKLVKPLREQALTPAGEIAGKVRTTQETYTTALTEPVVEGTLRRQAVRELIGRYRENYQV